MDRSRKPRGWTGRSVGARWQHRFFYFLIRVGGLTVATHWVYIVAFFYVVLFPSVRAKTRHYLSRRFPDRTGMFQKFADSFRMVVGLGKSLVDRAAFGLLGPDSIEVDFVDKQAILDVLDEGQGLVLINSHVGCWQVAVSAFAGLKRPVSIVMKRVEGDVDLHYFEHSGEATPFDVIDPGLPLGGILQMMGVLGRKEILGVMGDRTFGAEANAIWVDFLGEPAIFPVSPYLLASATGAPIVVLFSHKTSRRSYQIRLVKTIRVPPGLGRNPGVYTQWAREFTAELERYVAVHPFQFFNFFDMWGEGEAPQSQARDGAS